MNTQTLNLAEVGRLQQAADWFIRLQEARGEEILNEWVDWCEADPRNLTTFEEIKRIWDASSLATGAGQGGAWARFAIPVSLVASLLLAVAVVFFIRGRPPSAHDAQTLSTPLAMHSDSILPDGSRLALGGLSRVSTQFSAAQRLIVVESGEVFFDVAKDSKRAFIVEVGPVAVTALGTAFNVRRGNERIVVTVTQGRVGISAESRQPVNVEAGQEISYSTLEHRFAVSTVDPALAIAWQKGVFKYVREPLADVVADVNRYTPRRIVIADDSLGRERYTGTVFGSRVEDWLEALQSAFPLRVMETPEAIVLLRQDRRSGPP